MDALKIIIGAALLALGAAFLYKPPLILSLNSLIRELLANDKRVILYHKKIAIFLISLSFIALYMGTHFEKRARGPAAVNPSAASRKKDSFQEARFGAVRDYYAGNYRESLKKTLRVLAERPDEEWAMIHLGIVYEMLGENERARKAMERAAAKYPQNKTAVRNLEMFGSNPKR
ncbi:MAG: tetratricopeptide repeat protein [Endomicrobiia bacterium]|nr:tetratricopeptide repeat protein [Endomicrobiia bacterium]